MTRAFHGVYQMRQKEKVPMRLAAYLVSVAGVAEACKRPEKRIESGSEE